jgi:hypothetical protein
MEQGKRNVVLGGVALVAIAIAVVVFAKTSTKAGPSKTVQVNGICLSCQKEAQINVPTAVRPPYTCPACNKSALYAWFYCQQCGKRFIPTLERREANGPLRIAIECRCPACGSTEVTPWDPTDPEQPDKGTATLPKWSEP